jgi:hypothetical protein
MRFVTMFVTYFLFQIILILKSEFVLASVMALATSTDFVTSKLTYY